jgi:hypothetical protein
MQLTLRAGQRNPRRETTPFDGDRPPLEDGEPGEIVNAFQVAGSQPALLPFASVVRHVLIRILDQAAQPPVLRPSNLPIRPVLLHTEAR